MLERIELVNFRCFEQCTVEFDKFNALVGKNNAGKSTLVDAFKLVANVLRFAPYRRSFLEDKDIPFSLTNLRYDYKEADTSIRAFFPGDLEVSVEFPFEGRPYATCYHAGNTIAPRDFLKGGKHVLGVIPPVGTFDVTEKPGNREYLMSVMVSHSRRNKRLNCSTKNEQGLGEITLAPVRVRLISLGSIGPKVNTSDAVWLRGWQPGSRNASPSPSWNGQVFAAM